MSIEKAGRGDREENSGAHDNGKNDWTEGLDSQKDEKLADG
jgi:hypothetical protein